MTRRWTHHRWENRSANPKRLAGDGVPEFLSLDEAAEAMSVSVKTIRRWIASGTLPAYRCGKRAIRIKLEDLEAAPRQIPSARC